MNSSPSYFVGIDVSKPYLDVHRLPDDVARRFDNSAKGHRQLIRWLGGRPVGMITLEASGGYERAVVVAMVGAGLKVFVAQPQIIHAFAVSLNQRAKNDQIDAGTLARYAQDRCGDVTPISKIDPVHEALAAQVMRRNQLVEAQTQEKNRLQQASDAFTRKSLKRSLAWHEREIARVEKQIDAAIAADAKLAGKSKTLQETRGIGPQTARTLIACLPELGVDGPKRLNALVGVAPYAADSGDKHGTRHIAGGRKLVRNAMYMAALSASRCNPVIARYYQALCSRGLAHKTALMACIRRLLAHLGQQLRRPTTPANQAA